MTREVCLWSSNLEEFIWQMHKVNVYTDNTDTRDIDTYKH